MPILSGDIKLIKSEVMADVPEGGGGPTSHVIADGVSNSIFPDISSVDRAGGDVAMRKVLAAVQTDDVDSFFGANIIIAEPPKDPNVSVTIFSTGETFDRRTDAQSRIESYLALGSRYSGLLFGNHLTGMMTVMLIQQQDRMLPVIGAVLVLIKNQGLVTELQQYVRVTSVSSQVLTFTDTHGDYQRRVVTCQISDPLRDDFVGFDATRQDSNVSYAGKTEVYNTIVANAARYYGVKPLTQPATLGSYSVQVRGAFESIIPSAQIETPIADARTNGATTAVVPSGSGLSMTVTGSFGPAQKLYIGGGVTINTLNIERGGVTLTDAGGKLMQGTTQVGTIDHANGIVSFVSAVWGTAGTHTVSYVPAVTLSAPSQTYSIPITLQSRSLSYVVTLKPLPTGGTLRVSYLAGGNWYVLSDDGTGILRGDDTAFGIGSINISSGTLTLTLGALPDVGSAIVLSWLEVPYNAVYRAGTLNNPKLYWPINADGAASTERAGKPLTPGTVVLTWDGKTATDNGAGELTGDATGFVDYAQGVVKLTPNNCPPPGTVVMLSSSTRIAATSASVNINGGTVATNIQPHTVSFDLNVQVVHTAVAGASISGTPVTKTVRVLDDGTGNLFFTDGANGNLTVGTINYTTGVMSISTGSNIATGGIDMEGVTISTRSLVYTPPPPAPEPSPSGWVLSSQNANAPSSYAPNSAMSGMGAR